MKKLLLLIILIFNLVSCTGNSQNNIANDTPNEIDQVSNIKTLFKHGKYYSISKQPNKISDETDTALFIVASSKIKNFKAIEPYNKELKKYIVLDKVLYPDTTGLTKEDQGKLFFPYDNHSSLELFYIAHYFRSRDSISKFNQYRYLLQGSLLKDTNNIFTLYDFAKEELSSMEYQIAEVLINRILEYEPHWEKAKQLQLYVQEQMKMNSIKSLKVSIADIAHFGIPYSEYDPNCKNF